MKTLNEKAMLVRLDISQWSGRKHDKMVDADIEKRHGVKKADENDTIGRYNKMLVSPTLFKAIASSYAKLKKFHYENTLPWFDDGIARGQVRILTSKNYEAYMKMMRQLRVEFDAATKEFIENYPKAVREAKDRLNGMFNKAEYPSTSTVEAKFGVRIGVEPLPSADDFRVDISAAESKKVKAEIEAQMKKVMADAMRDVWDRLYDVVERMSTKLSEEDGIFRNTLIENITELVALLPGLNLTDDPKLEAMRTKIAESLCTYDPEDLREDEDVRDEAAKAAEDILAAMSGYITPRTDDGEQKKVAPKKSAPKATPKKVEKVEEQPVVVAPAVEAPAAAPETKEN